MTATTAMAEIRGNEPAIREILTYIELHPEGWDQRDWANACGTTHCFAGWAYTLLGQELAKADLEATEEDGQTWKWWQEHIPRVACQVLGLTEDQGEDLFMYTEVYDQTLENGCGEFREPTFAEFCERVYEVTGIRHIKQGATDE